MLGHRKTSLVQWHFFAAICGTQRRACSEYQISRNERSRRLPNGAMGLADAHVSVRVDHRAQHPRPAWNDLALFAGCLDLCPLQHRFDDGAVTFCSRGLHCRCTWSSGQRTRLARALERRIFAIASYQREIMMRHLRTTLEQKSCQFTDLIDVLGGRRGYGVNLEPRIFALQGRQGIVSLHRLGERVVSTTRNRS